MCVEVGPRQLGLPLADYQSFLNWPSHLDGTLLPVLHVVQR